MLKHKVMGSLMHCPNRKLRHPNIVCLMAFAKDDRFYYFVTSYVSGGNLDDFIFVKVRYVA